MGKQLDGSRKRQVNTDRKRNGGGTTEQWERVTSTESARCGNERESGSGVTAAISRARGRYRTEREWRSVRGGHGSVAGSRRIGKYGGGGKDGRSVVR